MTASSAKNRVRPSVAKHDGRNGGARRGAGRKEGAATRRTREIADKLATDGGITPLSYMLDVLRTDPDELKAKQAAGELDDTEYMVALQTLTARRDWAAEKAGPYIHPRLASIEQKDTVGSHEAWLAIIQEGIEASNKV